MQNFDVSQPYLTNSIHTAQRQFVRYLRSIDNDHVADTKEKQSDTRVARVKKTDSKSVDAIDQKEKRHILQCQIVKHMRWDEQESGLLQMGIHILPPWTTV